MANLPITIFFGIVTVIISKIIWTWIRQLRQTLLSNISSPGLPLPLLGHSHHFFNVPPQNIVDVLSNIVKRDEKRRKVRVY